MTPGARNISLDSAKKKNINISVTLEDVPTAQNKGGTYEKGITIYGTFFLLFTY